MSPRVLLSLATVFAIIGFVFVVASFVLDSWTVYEVDRRKIIDAFNQEPELNVRLKDAFTKNVNYFTREQGILWTCFPDSLPTGSDSFIKFFQPCIKRWNIDHFPSDAAQEHFNKQQTIRMWVMRATAGFYLFGTSLVLVAFVFGCMACFKRSSTNCGYTGFTLLVGALFITAAIGCFLWVDYMERTMLDVPPFYKSWEPVLKNTTKSHYGYCFAGAWIGVAFLIGSAIMFFIAKYFIRKDDEMAMVAKQGGYMMPYYEKTATMMPYGYNTYGGSAYPYPFNPYTYGNAGGYYAYQTYGR